MENESLDELQKQLLTCPVCLDDFQDDTRTKVLPCLHLLCETCIPKIVKDGILPCPTCRMEHTSGSFPTDNTTRDLSDFVVVKKSPNVPCEGLGCEETNMASHRCRPCGEFLCLDCVAAHRRTTVTRSHELIPLEELRDATDFNAFCHPQTCPIHPGKPLEIYCSKDDCQKPICVTCAVVNHRYLDGHELKDINDIANQKREAISFQITGVKEKTETISKVSELINEEEKEIRSRADHVYREIDAVIETLHQQIDRAKDTLQETVVKISKQKCQNLEEQKTKLKHLKTNMEHAVLYSDKVVCHSNIPAFLQLDRTIADRLQNLMLEQFDEEPWELAAFGLDCQGVNGEVQNALTRMMNIWSSSVFPPKTNITQMKHALPGVEAVFNIELYTSEGKSVAEGVHFDAMVTDPRGDSLPGKIKDSGLDNGKYVVTYTAMVEGDYLLELRMQNKVFAKHTFPVGFCKSQAAIEEMKSPKILEMEAPPFPHQIMSTSPDVFSTIRNIRFFLDKETVHKDVSVSEDGTTFSNSLQSVIPKSNVLQQTRHRKFKGARGTHVFTQPGRYFYEVILEMKIVAQLQENNIAFEIGIARKGSIDNKKYIEGQPYACSMIGAHHPPCDSVCVHVVRQRKVLLHKPLVKNHIDEECRIVLGFLLDTDQEKWEIYNSEQGEKLCVVPDVNCDEPLFPVVSGYNPSQVQVTATFVTGHQSIANHDE